MSEVSKGLDNANKSYIFYCDTKMFVSMHIKKTDERFKGKQDDIYKRLYTDIN